MQPDDENTQNAKISGTIDSVFKKITGIAQIIYRLFPDFPYLL
jgi:hypothetical protein